MKEIWIVEYCENVGEYSEYSEVQGAFATRELAEKYVDEQAIPELYCITQTSYYYE